MEVVKDITGGAKAIAFTTGAPTTSADSFVRIGRNCDSLQAMGPSAKTPRSDAGNTTGNPALDDIDTDATEPLFVDTNPDRFEHILDWYSYEDM